MIAPTNRIKDPKYHIHTFLLLLKPQVSVTECVGEWRWAWSTGWCCI